MVARYDAVAEFYTAGWSDACDDPATVALLDLVGDIGGARVLDLACGHGRVTRRLAELGGRVAGVDVSGVLIERAEAAERARALGIRYLQADVAAAGLLGGERFDAVVCGFGLSDIDDLDGAVALVSRLLAVGGRFVFCILHRAFLAVPVSPDPGRARAATARRRPGAARSTLRRQVGTNHRMVSTYLNKLRHHGLWLDAVSEPDPPAEWLDQQLDSARMPVFFAARCIRAQESRRPAD